MNSTITTIEGVADLVHQMEQEVAHGTIRLSAEAWAELNRDLEEARPLLDRNEVDEGELEDAAWLVIAAFEANETLAKHFGDKLASLTTGVKLVGRGLLDSKTEANDTLPSEERLLKNKMVILSCIRRLRERMLGNKSSDKQS